MSSKTAFRELAMPTERAAQIDWWWGLVAVMALATVLGVAQLLDDHGQRMFDASVVEQRTRTSMLPNIRAAYEQGQRDALAAAEPGANGLQIASTCMAWWYDSGTNKRAMRERVCGAAGSRP